MWDITFLRIVLALVCFILLVIFSLLIPKPVDIQYLIIVFGLALLPSAFVLEWVFQGLEQMEYVGIGRVLKGIIFAGLVFFIRNPDHLIYAPASYVAGIVGAAVVLICIYVKKFGVSIHTVNYANLKNTLIIAVPLAAGSFITQINYNFGTFALGLFQSDEIVGLFSAAYKIILFLWAFAVVAASNAVLPPLARSYKSSVSLYCNSLKNLLRIFIMLALPIGIGGSVLASRIIGFLYPPEYQRAVIVLQISIWVVVIVIYRVIFENALIVAKSQRNYFIGYIIAGILTVIGNLIVAPIYGLIGPSIVGVCSESFLFFYFVSSCKFIRPSLIVKMTLKPFIAASLMGAVIFFVPLNLFILVFIGIVLYFILLLLFRSVRIDEVKSSIQAVVP